MEEYWVDVLFIVLTTVLVLVTIIVNLLVIAVIVASEKIARNVACLLFLCVSHLELAAVMMIHAALDSPRQQDPGDHLIVADKHSGLTTHAPSLDMSITDGETPIQTHLCSGEIVMECFEKSAVLWSLLGVLGITLNQYIYIEKPFWYGVHVTTKHLVLYSVLSGIVSHIIGMLPLMTGVMSRQQCDQYDLLLGVRFNVAYSVVVILIFISIASMSVRMLVLAEGHRKNIKKYNNGSKSSSRADSYRFVVILLTTLLISSIVPVTCSLVSSFSDYLHIPHNKVNTLYLVGAIIYAVFYGNRTPEGFLGSVRLAVCCCLSVKEKQADVEVSDAVRFAMMRLGHVMVKIDEQAAHRRHSSYKRRKQQIATFLKPSSSTREHGKVRPYKSHVPMWRRQKSNDSTVAAVHGAALKSASLDFAAIECKKKKKPVATRLASWLPKSYGTTSKAKFEVPQASQGTAEDNNHAPSEQVKDRNCRLVTVISTRADNRLSRISEKSESLERPDITQTDKQRTCPSLSEEDERPRPLPEDAARPHPLPEYSQRPQSSLPEDAGRPQPSSEDTETTLVEETVAALAAGGETSSTSETEISHVIVKPSQKRLYDTDLKQCAMQSTNPSLTDSSSSVSNTEIDNCDIESERLRRETKHKPLVRVGVISPTSSTCSRLSKHEEESDSAGMGRTDSDNHLDDEPN